MKNNKVLMAIIFTVLAAAAIVVGNGSDLILYIAPIVLAFCLVSYGPVSFGAALAAGIGGVCAISGYLQGIHVFLAVALSALVLAGMIKGKCSYRIAMASCAAISFISLYAVLFLPQILKGGDVLAVTDECMKAIAGFYTAGVPAEMAETAQILYDTMVIYSSEIVFASYVSTALFAGFLQVILTYALFRKKFSLRKMAKFKDWQLSKSFMWGCLLMLAAAIIISQTGVTYAGTLTVIVLIIILAPLVLVGLSCTEFFIQLLPEGRALRRVITYALAAFCFPYCIFMFVLEAVIDKIFKMRKRVVVIKKD